MLDHPPRRRTYARDGATARLRLGYTRPFAWQELLAFLGARAIPGVEAVVGGRYLRTVSVDGVAGWISVAPAEDGAHLVAELHLARSAALPTIEARLRRVFDLDADVVAIRRRLSRDPRLSSLLAARPGLRVPGAWEPFELAVRAILGQQVSVAAARTLAGRFAATQGQPLDPPPPEGVPHLLFPSAAAVRPGGLGSLGLTRPRAAALAGLSRAVACDPALLAPGSGLDATLARLVALPGVGPWTAHYIAMRALREPDAFPHGDLGLLRALEEGGRRPSPAELLRRAEAWRPYRAYAALHLWSAGAPPQPGETR
jgi:AraC family transcriptional regulator of adaptative response / DNA-3-methyladenine glycosylase II